ncbi:transposase [Candidatus Poribacteria bacterium]|nr:transposase [Candidatus Poribacteria bacterium]
MELTSEDISIISPGIIPVVRTKQAVMVYYDETEIHRCPDIGKGYQLINQQNRITSPGQDEVKYLLGGVVYPTGEGLYQIFDRKRTMEVQSYLQTLCEMLDEYFIFLIWDNASTHTTDMLCPFFDAYAQQIYPVFLPTYSPWLNKIERLWRQMRADVTRNSFFASIADTCQTVIDWLGNVSYHKFMSLMGIDFDRFPHLQEFMI